MRNFLTAIILLSIANMGIAQCENWVGHPQENEASDAHSIYRTALKAEDFATAFENWEKAFAIAPGADGKRDYHMTDGAKLYLNKFQNATDEAQKTEFKAKVVEMYDQAVECTRSKSIMSDKCQDDACIEKRISYLRGRQGYDMYYTLNSVYSKNYEVLMESIALGGNDTEYIVFDPLAKIAVYQYQNGILDKAKALEIYQTIESVANYNIENNDTYSTYFDDAWKNARVHYSAIESEIFDCAFFKNKLQPSYDADPDNPDVIKKTLARLKAQGCDESDAFVMELDKKWKKYANETNAQMLAADKTNNPAKYAKKLRKEGDYAGAVEYYQKAISVETDMIQKASYLHSVAQIQYSEFKEYSKARKNALEAAKLRPGWGKPYITIGDMYGRTARSCGDDWNQRLAITAAIEKYAYAKSIDPESAADASSRIAKYRPSLPEKQEGFMRKISAGQSVKVGCWIGETVKVQFK